MGLSKRTAETPKNIPIRKMKKGVTNQAKSAEQKPMIKFAIGGFMIFVVVVYFGLKKIISK